MISLAMRKKIIFFHTLNDLSGSPKILSIVIRGMIERGYEAELYTSYRKDGFLSDIKGVKYHYVYYKFHYLKPYTFLLFVIIQIRYFFAALSYWNDDEAVFYINTIMPFGAALGASLIRKEIVYHVHEYPVKKHLINRIAIKILTKKATRAIFVSDYLSGCYKMAVSKKKIVYNGLPPDFIRIACKHEILFTKKAEILMVSSLKKYKGIDVFLELSNRIPQYNFTLVLNTSLKEIKRYFANSNIPENLKLIEATSDLHVFYSRSHLVMNLSIPNLCVESFGLTALEAMSYGIPVIVPPTGGISELVEDGYNGFKIDSRDTENLVNTIRFIFSDKENYLRMSENCRNTSTRFSSEKMITEIDQLLMKSGES